MLETIRSWLWKHSVPYFNLEGYMERRWVFVCPWFSVRMHHILRSDIDRHMHDHPFNYMTIILKGGYWEHTPKGVSWVGKGSVRVRKAEALHRLELPKDETAWTLFFMGPRKRKWGFQTEEGWVDYETYLGETEHA